MGRFVFSLNICALTSSAASPLSTTRTESRPPAPEERGAPNPLRSTGVTDFRAVRRALTEMRTQCGHGKRQGPPRERADPYSSVFL
jgi:hypothetical protein